MDNTEIFNHIDYLNCLKETYKFEKIPDCIIIPMGYRCSSSEIIRILNLKKESYPFDWTISKLSTIKDCIINDFKQFLKTENYVKKEFNTYNIIDSVKLLVTIDQCSINTYYNQDIIDDFNTYDSKLSLVHHDIFKTEDYEYYKRCINRFKNILKSDSKKF